MAINIDNTTAGSVTLAASSSGTATITLPNTTGTIPSVSGTPTSGQLAAFTNATTVQGIAAPTSTGNTLFTTDGTNWSSTAKIVQGTSVASTSGTSIDFTSIPSWVKRITFMLNGVSTSGTSPIQIRLGTSGGFVTSGYSSNAGYITATNAAGGIALFTTGFYVVQFDTAAATLGAALTISSFGGNVWTYSGTGTRVGVATTALFVSAAPFSLGGTLTQIRLTTVNGTDTFDAGSVNILYE